VQKNKIRTVEIYRQSSRWTINEKLSSNSYKNRQRPQNTSRFAAKTSTLPLPNK